MNIEKKINLLMISSSSSLGGGTKNMFMLGENLKSDFNIFYAIPKNKDFNQFLNQKNHIEISEREIKFNDVKRLKRFANLNSIDIIHSHGKGAGVLGRIIKVLIKKPHIYSFHGIHLTCHNWLNKLIYLSYEYFFGWIDSVKVLVSKSEESFAKKSNIFLGKNSIIISNGVSYMKKKESFQDEKNDNDLLKSSKINVITICRFVDQKNIKDILKIALELSNIDFYIIGDGPLWNEIKSEILKIKIRNVFLIGKKKDVFKYLYLADIYLSTSLYEGLPISLLEAMSIGLPIVASNVTGNCDTIENGKSGILYDLRDTNMAVDFLKKLAQNGELRKKLGNASYQRQRDKFSINSMLSKYKNLYKTVYGKTYK